MSGDNGRDIRKMPETERMLRQFLKLDGPKGATDAYKRGWVYNFEFTDEERAAVVSLTEAGANFDDAFDYVAQARMK